MDDQNIYHHNDQTPRISVKVEKNTKGHNYEASVSNCTSPEQALELVQQVIESLRRIYGTPQS